MPVNAPLSEEPVFDIMYQCRAMRRLKSDPVPEELLLQLVDAALQGPSGSNA
jgi:nitroreductase